MSSLQKELEKHFFRITFKEIQEHPKFKKLKLTKDEIIINRHEIKQVLESIFCCGNSQKFCKSLDKHYTLKRNSDNKLILCEEKCNKVKEYENIPEQEINKHIKRLLLSTTYNFDCREALKAIQVLKNYDKDYEVLKKMGDPELKKVNIFLPLENGKEKFKKELAIAQAFHGILIGNNVMILKANELKEICTTYLLNLKSFNVINHSINYYQILETELLIIVDFGLESEYTRYNYYLDFLPDILNIRNIKKKETHIISPSNWELIKQDVTSLSTKKASELTKFKLEELSRTMKSIFFEEDS